MRTPHRGFSLLETMIALVLVGVSMTALVMAFVSSGKYGVLSRRQATALTVARSQAEALSRANWTFDPADVTCNTKHLDARLLDNNPSNNALDGSASFADPKGLFAQTALPTGADVPDSSLGTINVGNESYDAYVNVAPVNDTDVGATF